MTDRTEHLEQVSRWLDENVVSYPTPQSIMLSDFEIDWEEMSGIFYLTTDGQRTPEPFRLSLAQNGWVEFHPPMFTSPLGAPASYSAIELTGETETAVIKLLKSIFPRLKPMGLDRETGALIGQQTPIEERISDRQNFNRARTLISRDGYTATASLDGSSFNFDNS